MDDVVWAAYECVRQLCVVFFFIQRVDSRGGEIMGDDKVSQVSRQDLSDPVKTFVLHSIFNLLLVSEQSERLTNVSRPFPS